MIYVSTIFIARTYLSEKSFLVRQREKFVIAFYLVAVELFFQSWPLKI
jgi:hypothetical protein